MFNNDFIANLNINLSLQEFENHLGLLFGDVTDKSLVFCFFD